MSNEFRIKKGLIVNETDFYVSGSKAGFGTITPSSPLEVYGSGSTVFSVNGASGQLFGVSDDLTDSLFSVNTIAGLPVIEAFADNTVKIGTFGNEELIVSESQVSIISASIYGPTYLEGNVGIGTTSPGAHLHIYGAGDEMLRLADNSATGNPYLSFYQTTTRRSFIQHHDTDDTLRIASEYGAIDFRTGTGGSEVQRMIIDSSGNVGIGTANPTSSLHVQGVGYFDGGESISFSDTVSDAAIVIREADFIYTRDGNNLRRLIGKSSSDVITIGTGGTSLINEIRLLPGSAGFTSFYDNSSETMRITGGNVGIGIINPTAKLHVSGTIADNREFQVGDDYLVVTGSNGYVGIGTTSPSKELTVQGEISSSGGIYSEGAVQADTFRGDQYPTNSFLKFNDAQSFGFNMVTLGAIGAMNFIIDTNDNDNRSFTWWHGSTDVDSATQLMDLDENGNLTVTGIITAQEFHTEFVSASIIYQSGSTKFGDTSDDVHSFSGSLRVTGSGDHYFTDGNVGIGTTSPSYKLEVNGDSKFQDLLTVANDIYPETNYVSNIGAINKKFLTLNVAELIVETLVASERRSTVGGRFNVGISTQLSQSISPASSSILVENNNLNPGDIIHLEGGTPAGTPQVEFMKVTSTASSGSGDGFSYTVDRNLDGTGANTWEAGSGVFNTGVTGSAGQSGTGFIDQYAINSLTTGVTTAGPTIAFMERTGSAFPDIDSRAVVGNLKGWYGYGTDIFGFASGDYKAQNITVDPFNGLRIRNVGDIQLQASSSFLSIGDDFLYDSNIGRLFVSGSNIDLVSPSFFLGGTTQYVSGSGGSIEISGSNFHLLNGNITASNVDLSGNINAQTGTIGGFTISADALSSSNFFLSGSATGNEFFISASNFNVKANGDLTASNANITGDIVATNITAINQGNIAGFTLSSNQLVDSNTGTSLVLKSDGQITGSQVLFTGGKISGSNVEIDVNTLNLDAGSGAIVIDSTNEVITVGNGAIRLDNSFGSESAGLEAINSSVIRVSADGSGNGISNYMSMFYSDATNWGMEVYGDSNTIFFAGEDGGTIKGILAGFDFYGDRIADNATGDTLILRSNGDITGSSVLFDGGTVGGFDITSTQINNSSGTDLILKSNGQITASAAQITGDITATSGQIAGFAISGDVIAGVSYSIDASAGAEGEYFISSSDVKIEGNGDAVFGEYSFALLEDSFGQNGLSRTSALSNIRVIQGIDANGHGGIFGVAADGSMYFAPISSSLLSGGSWNSFSRELKYNLPNDRWEFETNVLFKDGLTSTGTVSGSQLESSGNTTVKGNLTVLGNTTISGTVDGHITVTPVASDSNNSNGVVVQDLTFDEFGHTNTIGTVDLDNRYLQLSGGTLTGGVSSNSQISSTKGTIGFANLANAAFLAGTTSNGIGIDSNEIRSKGSTLYIGTIDADKIDFGTGGVNSQVVIASGGNLGVGIDTPSSKLHVSGSSNVLLVEGSGSTLFDVQGSQGQLFSVTDNLTGTLFSVNDISGIPILSVDSDDTVTMGTFGANALVVTGSLVGIGTSSPQRPLTVEGSVSASGDVQIGSGTGANAYGRLQVNQSSNTDEEGIGILSSGAGRSMRLYVDETNSYINSGDGGSGILVLNEGDGNVGIGTTSPGGKLNVAGGKSLFSPAGDTNSGINSITIVSRNPNDSAFTANALTAYNASTSWDIEDRSTYTVSSRVKNSSIYTYAGEHGSAAAATQRFVQFNSSNTGPLLNWVFYQYDGSGTTSADLKKPSKLFEVQAYEAGSTVTKLILNGDGDLTLSGNLDINGTGTSTIDGNLTVGGTVTAQEFHTEFVSASIIYQSGSTKFGDTSDDVHSFSGSLRVTGSGDHYFTDGNVGIGTTSPSEKLEVEGNILVGDNHFIGNQTTFDNFLLQSSTDENVVLSSAKDIYLSTSGTGPGVIGDTRLFVSSSGNVGIGTLIPGNTLHVFKNATTGPITSTTVANAGLRIQDSGANMYIDGNSIVTDATGYLTTIGSNDFVIGTNNTARIHVDGGGNVGIGTTSPSQTLTVAGNISGSGNLYIDGTTNLGATNVSELNVINTSTPTIDIYDSGNAGGGGATGKIRFQNTAGNAIAIGYTDDETDNSNLLITTNANSTYGGYLGLDTAAISDNVSDIILDARTNVILAPESGSVGIGETNPLVPLHISRDSASGENIALLLDNNNTTAGSEIGILFRSNVGSTNTDFEIFGVANGANDMDLVFQSDGSNERMRIDSSGNVGIGTTIPSTKLEVNGTATVTALVETSTRELKENIETLEDQSSIVDSLQPVSYTWKESKEEDFGLIAEDVADIAPHLVHRNEDGKPTGIKYSKLSVLLLDVVQKQNTLINDLNERITKLENERGN